MQEWLKSNEWRRISVHITFMIEIQKEGDQIIETFCKIGFPQKLVPPIFNLQKFQENQKTSADSGRNHWNLVNDEEFGSIEILRLKYRREPNIFDIHQSWFPSQIRSPLFDFKKFQDSEKSTPESCRNHWNLMNDKEFGFRKLLKLK